jgi:hypothetical protein
MNQFGATLGGPILKDRTFFFLDFEAIRQTLGTAVTGSLVPSPSFRAATLALHPELAPILNAYPQGQAVAATDATGNTFTYSGTSARRLQETSGLARIDHRVSDRTALFARFNLDRLVGDDPNGVLRDTLASILNPYNAVIGLDHSFSPRILNSTKLGFNRSDFHSTQESALPFAVTVAGFSTLNNTIQKVAVSNIYSVLDTANFTFGRHSVKTGVEIRAVQINQSATASDDLTVAFSSVANLKANSVSAITLNSKVPLLGLRKIEDFAYVQDQYKLRPNITVTAGLRYEFYSNFHEQHGRGLVFDPRTCPTGGFCPVGSDYYFPYKLDIEPRLAVSWAPYADGKTVVTSGYGVYAGDGQLGDLNAPINNVATRVALTNAKTPLSYPVDAEIAAGLSTSLAPRGLYRDRANQQVQAWSLNVQQAVAHNTVAEFAYIGTKGTHLFTRSYINGLDPVTRIAPIAGLGLIDYKTTDSNSNFHALLINLNREFDHGLSLKANYQWSHSINDGAVGGGEALSTENVNCRICDRASSDQDIRHYFTAGTVYQLPVGHGRQYLGSAGRLTDALFGGWQISAISTARTGLPVNITATRIANDIPDGNTNNQRPNAVPYISQYPVTKSKGAWLNRAAYAVPPSYPAAPRMFGNLGKNSARAPGLWQIDPALEKRFSLTERASLRFRAEAFNVLNRQQIGQPVALLNAGNFGQIVSSVNSNATGSGTPRNLQFMLRLEY